MTIYKIVLKNEDLSDLDVQLHFIEKKTAEAVMIALEQMLAKGKKLDWDCSTIEVFSHEEAFNQFINAMNESKSNNHG